MQQLTLPSLETIIVHQPPEPYEDAAIIFQVSTFCNRICEGCYASSSGETLDPELYISYLKTLNKGSLVAIRGGEPTLVPGWFEYYFQQALDMGLKVTLETNGNFILGRDYGQSLIRLSNPSISVRVSFDEKHIQELPYKKKKLEFHKMRTFAIDAYNCGISFGFYSLGMGKEQITAMIKGTELEHFEQNFHSLMFYPDIRKAKINGIYVDVKGISHKNISG